MEFELSLFAALTQKIGLRSSGGTFYFVINCRVTYSARVELGRDPTMKYALSYYLRAAPLVDATQSYPCGRAMAADAVAKST
jgi:hypothetical protein